MFNLSPIKIMIIVAVILVLFGPDKLPQVARQLGAAWKGLRSVQERIESEVREVVPDLPTSADIVRIARSPVNLLNSLADRVNRGDLSSDSPEGPEAPTVYAEDGPPIVAEEPEEPPVAPPPAVRPQPSVADPSLN